MKKIEDYLPYLIGCECDFVTGEGTKLSHKLLGVEVDYFTLDVYKRQVIYKSIIPHLRSLSDMSEEEIRRCGEFICAIPNSLGENCRIEIKNSHNSVGAHYYSDKYTHGQYFSIWTEKNKPESIGHIEVGWFAYEGLDKRKKSEHWKIGGCHELTRYLLSKHFDIFGLIEAGLAIDQSKIKLN